MALNKKSLNFYLINLLLISHIGVTLCWNEMAHEAIALTAMSSIRDKNLAKLISALHGGDLVDFAHWGHAVETIIPQSSPLYLQPQHDTSCTNLFAECENENGLCLLNGIKFFYHRLLPHEIEKVNFKYPKNIDFTDMDSIKYLVSLIADLHDPIKLGFKSDNFGGNVKVSIEHTPFFMLTVYNIMQRMDDSNEKPVVKTLNEAIESYLLEEFAKKHGEFWYGGWTHVNSLGIKFHEEVDMFKKSLHNSFDIWAQETFQTLCTIYQKLIEDSNKSSAIGKPFSSEMTSDLQIYILQLLRRQILLAGARISIVLNHILSTKTIDSRQSEIQLPIPSTESIKPNILIESIEPSYFAGFFTNFTIFLAILLLFYIIINTKNIKMFLFKPTL